MSTYLNQCIACEHYNGSYCLLADGIVWGYQDDDGKHGAPAYYWDNRGDLRACMSACADAVGMVRTTLQADEYRGGAYCNADDVITLEYYDGATTSRNAARVRMVRAYDDADGAPMLVLREHAHHDAEHDEYITDRRARAEYDICERCGCLITRGAGENWGGALYCSDCANERSGMIENWHYHKGDWESIEAGETTRAERIRLWGLELETERGRGCKSRAYAAERVADICGDAVVFEHDSSTRDGFEIITQPHTWRALELFPLEDVCDELTELGYTSHDGGRCGFHVHVSAEHFGETEAEQAARISTLIRWYSRNEKELCALSRRKNYTYCEIDSDAYYMRARGAALAREKRDDGNRYTAINLCNWAYGSGTIEFRLCRGSLNARALRAWLELHKALIDEIAAGASSSLSWNKVVEKCTPASRAYIHARMAARD